MKGGVGWGGVDGVDGAVIAPNNLSSAEKMVIPTIGGRELSCE